MYVILKIQIEKIHFGNNCFPCPTIHSWSYNYMLWSICVPYIDLPGIFTVCHEQWSARKTQLESLAAFVLERRSEVVVGAKATQYFLWICKISVRCILSSFSMALSDKVCCYFCPTSCPKCELHSQSTSKRSTLYFRHLHRHQGSRYWQTERCLADKRILSQDFKEERWNWSQKKEGKW